jgi:hypothetical protein
MYVERAIRIVAGSMILISVGIGFFVNKWVLFLAVFVGANLLQFGFSKQCPLEYILLKFGVPPTPCVHCPVVAQIQKMAEDQKENKVLQVLKDLDMTRIIRIAAGTFVLTSALLGLFVSEWALIFTVFVGVNLLQFGFTNLCPMATILRFAGVTDNETVPITVVVDDKLVTTEEGNLTQEGL